MAANRLAAQTFALCGCVPTGDAMTDMPAPAAPRGWFVTTLWAAVAATGLVGLGLGAWLTALCAAGTLVLAGCLPAFTAVSGLRFPSGLPTGVLAFAAAALLLGEMAGFYVSVPWWDLALHVVASVVLAQVGWALVLLLTAGDRPRTPLWIGATLAFGFSMMVGGLWEVMEFTLDGTLGTNAQRSGLPDTMTDLIADAVGAAWGAMAVNMRLAGRGAWPGSGLVVEWMTRNPIVYGAWPRWSAHPEDGAGRAFAADDGPLQGRR